MLRDFAKRYFGHPTPGSEAIGATVSVPGELTDVKLHLDQPFYGEVNGHPVTIIGQGNMAGFSPASWCVDAQHENAWLPTGVILITDPRFEPLSPGARLPSASTTR